MLLYVANICEPKTFPVMNVNTTSMKSSVKRDSFDFDITFGI